MRHVRKEEAVAPMPIERHELIALKTFRVIQPILSLSEAFFSEHSAMKWPF